MAVGRQTLFLSFSKLPVGGSGDTSGLNSDLKDNIEKESARINGYMPLVVKTRVKCRM